MSSKRKPAQRTGRPVTAQQHERQQKAAELRVAGNTWPAIARELGYQTEAGARAAVRRYYDRAMKDTVESMRPVLQDRGEWLWRQAARKIQNPESTPDEWNSAMRHALQTLTYLARVNGLLDQAPQVEVNITNAPDVQVLRQQFLNIIDSATQPTTITESEDHQ